MRYLVVGAGKSGVSAANFLVGMADGVTITDTTISPSMPYDLNDSVVRVFGRQDDALLNDVATIVLSPGVPLTIPLLQEAQRRAIPIISEVELAFRHLKGTVIAVTGSNGKSTTTTLIGEILKVAGRKPIVAGNIGDPLTAVFDRHLPRTYVIELSSFQLETIDSFHADVALLLNITPDHMDRYPTFDAYAAAKYRVFRNQKPGDTAIVNATERRQQSRGTSDVRVWKFSASEKVEQGAWQDGDQLVMRLGGDERRIPRSSLRLQGTPNVENALAAWLAARAVGVEDVDVQIAFGTFNGLPHRMVTVREINGVRWVNDSKGTNVDATLRSLDSYSNRSVILILGGKDKGGEFERMRESIGSRVRTVLTIGSAGDRIGKALQGVSEVVPAGDMEQAVRWAHEHARTGETVLLSPACASFDQYKNFEHRGDHFEQLVRGLKG